VGIENVVLRELPGLGFLILGIAAQLYLIRVFSIPRALAWVVLICQALAFFSNWEPFYIWLHAKGTLAGALVMLWWWSITPIAVAIWIRRRFSAKRVPEKPIDGGRRELLRTSFTALAAAPAVALGVGMITRKDLTVREVSMKFANLPKDLRGLRLVQLSDIHMSAFYSAADLARAVDAANGLRADLMFVTGDLITDRFDPLDDCLLELKRLRAVSGIWGCLGNHEMHANVQGYTTRKARELGMRFLRKEIEMLRFGIA
jgi:hypothetical protein